MSVLTNGFINMTKKENINKYDLLFDSGVELASRIGLCKREGIIGATDEEINEFCVKHRINLPLSSWSYARFFGHSSQMIKSDYNIAFSLREFDYALHQASLKKDWLDGMNLREYIKSKNFKVNYDDEIPEDNDGIYTPEINNLMDADNIAFYSYDPFSRSFSFFDTRQENPILYDITAYRVVTSLFLPVTNQFRNSIFMFLVTYAAQDFNTHLDYHQSTPQSGSKTNNKIDYSGGFECIQFYQELFKNNQNTNVAKLKYYRDLFYQLNNSYEEETEQILSITEFENKFINYLHDNDFFD